MILLAIVIILAKLLFFFTNHHFRRYNYRLFPTARPTIKHLEWQVTLVNIYTTSRSEATKSPPRRGFRGGSDLFTRRIAASHHPNQGTHIRVANHIDKLLYKKRAAANATALGI